MVLNMVWMGLKSVRRMSKTVGGCTKLGMITAISFFTIYTVWFMLIEKAPMAAVTYDISERPVPVTASTNSSLHSLCEVNCQPDQFSFYIRSGYKSSSGPIICFQGEMYMSDELKNVGRGLNIVVVNHKKQVPHIVEVFDTYETDVGLLRLLKLKTTPDDIVMVASFDDSANNLKDSGRTWLAKYGSKLVGKLKFRESFVMIGMRGLEQGKAIEYYELKHKKQDFANPIEKAGCFSVPMGAMQTVPGTQAKIFQGSELQAGAHVENCGLPKPCPSGEIPISISSGIVDKGAPNVCVDGILRWTKGLNDAGRGLNIMALNPSTFQVEASIHVDSYQTDSTDADFFIETLAEGTILIFAVADEASTRLEQSTRELFNHLGSGHIQNLRFRDLWYMVTQIGLKGFTAFEEIRYAPFSRDWPQPLENKFCIPKKIPRSLSIPELGISRNDKRREFCTRHEGYQDFCNPSYVDEELKTIGIYTKDLKNHVIYETPIILIPGINHNAFVNMLQTTLLQPGLRPDLVSVFWDRKVPEYRDLALMFGFRDYILESSKSYSEQIVNAMLKATAAYPQASHFIVIEEDLMLAPDFLPFMAGCMDVMSKDESLIGASAWNINGFQNVSGSATDVYRVKDFPGLGFLIKTSVITDMMKTMGSCCQERAWFGWQTELKNREMLVPALSRVYRMPMFGAMGASDLARELFLRPRETYLEPHPIKLDIQHLQATNYEKFVKDQVARAQVLPSSSFDLCLEGTMVAPDIASSLTPGVVFFQQNGHSDFKLLSRLCRCFGLVNMNGTQPKNLHNGMLRFNYAGRDIFLVGTSSPYYMQERHYHVLMDPDYFKLGPAGNEKS